jgi:hypothetical protein
VYPFSGLIASRAFLEERPMFSAYRLPTPPEPVLNGFAPRALLVRSLIPVEVTPSELHRLIRSLEAEAVSAAEIGLDDYADFLFRRCAELRGAAR